MYCPALSTCVVLAVAVFAKVCGSCPVLRSDSVDIVCKYRGDVVPCNSTILPGTKATMTCAYSYVPTNYDPGYREITCLPEGMWDRAVIECFPECGKAMTDGETLIAYGVEAKRGSFPWHVGIYSETEIDVYDQICGGTLVKPDLVISAAHCFYNEQRRVVEDTGKFWVAGGKFYRLFDWPEPYIQKLRIKRINIRERYFGHERNYELDIALLRLDTPFTMTTFVRTVCIDWDNMHRRDQLQDGKFGKIMGWGLNASGIPSHELQEANLPFVTYGDCMSAVPPEFRDFIVIDKICAGYLNGTSVCPGDSGGGLCFESNGVWFLRGIVSIAPRRPVNDRPCEINYYTAFTDVGYHLDWIRSVYFSPRNRDGELSGCIVPDHPANGWFRVSSCPRPPCYVEPGSRVPIFSMLIYYCDRGFTIEGNLGSMCYDNVWLVKPPICSRANCGIAMNDSTLLIVNGSTVKHHHFPWCIGIYWRLSFKSCGTLISPDLVVVASSSFFDSDGGLTHEISELNVTAGKYYLDYIKAELYAQVSSVREITRQPRRRSDSDFVSVALIRLTTPFRETTLVRPVCLDWDNRYTTEQLRVGNIGRAWTMNSERDEIGTAGKSVSAAGIEEIDLVYVPWKSCKSASGVRLVANVTLHQDNHDITIDDFCARTVPDYEYVGSYIMSEVFFQSDGLWYLRGVVSTVFWADSPEVVSSIGRDLEWIKAAYDVQRQK